jgi:flagellar hook-associated protein 2
MNTLNASAFQNQVVTSSDSNGTHVTASATGATTGTYDVQVDKIATKAKMTLGASSLTGSVGQGSYTITSKNGTTTAFTIGSTNDTLSGFKDAINNSGADVNATIVDSGDPASPGGRYKLIVSSDDTGAAENGGVRFSITQNSGANALLSTGSATSLDAENAHFWVNGIELTRSSNTVSDAVEGMTFTLKSGGQTSSSTPTTLTVATDKDGITKALQDVVSKFNAVLKVYKDNSQGATYASNTSSTSSSSSSSSTDALTPAGPLANQPSLRTLISGVRSTIMSVPSTLSGGNYYKSAVELGLKTNQDGTLSLDTTALKAALDKDPSAVANVFNSVNTALQDSVNKITSPGSGSLAMIRQGIDNQNSMLNFQIDSMQARLNRQRVTLQNQYANLESTVGQLQSAGQSLSSLA